MYKKIQENFHPKAGELFECNLFKKINLTFKYYYENGTTSKQLQKHRHKIYP